MKKIILLTIIFGAVSTFFIYKNFYHEDMNIVALGDGIALGETAFNVQGYSYNDYLKDYYEENSILKEYITEFSNTEETTTTLLLKLQTNYTLESTNTSITQAIAKAKILTISLGMYELNNKKELTTAIIDEYINNMEKIIKFLRIYNKKDIFLISLYPTLKINKEQSKIINTQLEKICQNYNIKFINIENITQTPDYFFTKENYYFNYKGHQYISEQIIDKV
mgnify:CR=1 FL=1